MLSDDELLANLERWYETKGVSDEHDELDDELKENFRQVAARNTPKAGDGLSPEAFQAQLGAFLISVKSQVKKTWVVPKAIMKTQGKVKKTPYYVVKIERSEK